MARELYIVKNVKGVPGLLVSDYVYKAGRVFSKDEWKWGEDSFQSALKSGRCELVKEEQPAEIIKPDVKAEIELLEEQYMALDPESDEAKKLFKKIEKMEAKK